MKIALYPLFAAFCIVSSLAFGQKIDIQGHRGVRGLMPENSIPGFIKAIDLGVTTLEMDVVISADGKVIVSHDPYISSGFCLDEKGNEIEKEKEKDINIFKLNYDDVILYDCGIKGNKDFPDQEKISVHKPLLSEVIDTCEQYIKSKGLPAVQYNIELKSSPSGDGIFNPAPNIFTETVFRVIDGKVPDDRIYIQSFDVRVLQSWKANYPKYRISLLVGNTKSISKNIDELGFLPDIYSPNYRLISGSDVEELHNLSVEVIPWTVNSAKEMLKQIDMGVDGIITDYPNRYFTVTSGSTE